MRIKALSFLLAAAVSANVLAFSGSYESSIGETRRDSTSRSRDESAKRDSKITEEVGFGLLAAEYLVSRGIVTKGPFVDPTQISVTAYKSWFDITPLPDGSVRIGPPTPAKTMLNFDFENKVPYGAVFRIGDNNDITNTYINTPIPNGQVASAAKAAGINPVPIADIVIPISLARFYGKALYALAAHEFNGTGRVVVVRDIHSAKQKIFETLDSIRNGADHPCRHKSCGGVTLPTKAEIAAENERLLDLRCRVPFFDSAKSLAEYAKVECSSGKSGFIIDQVNVEMIIGPKKLFSWDTIDGMRLVLAAGAISEASASKRESSETSKEKSKRQGGVVVK